MQRAEIFIEGQHILYDAAAITNIEPGWFNPEYWRQRNSLSGQAFGRGTSHFFRFEGREYVLRHYHRGGLAAHFLDDRYIRGALKDSRAWREWDILAHLRQNGLPVPEPVAARVIFDGLFYRADIIMRKLQGESTLSQTLKKRALFSHEWKAVGELIRRFHRAGVWHADLNAHNILLGTDRIYLLDFDNSHIGRSDGFRLQLNLRRLRRSLFKLARQNHALHFSADDWRDLLRGYRSSF